MNPTPTIGGALDRLVLPSERESIPRAVRREIRLVREQARRVPDLLLEVTRLRERCRAAEAEVAALTADNEELRERVWRLREKVQYLESTSAVASRDALVADLAERLRAALAARRGVA